jgi:hypothetical protein
MKYQPQHDLIDPDYPAPDEAREHTKDVDRGAPDDAYVIGEHGSSLREIDLNVSVKAKTKATTKLERWVKPAAYGLAALAVVLTVWNVARLAQGPPAPPKPTPHQSKQALYMGVMKIDAYRRVHGVTPDTLADAGIAEAGVYAYSRLSPTRYVLSFRTGGSKIEYDSNESKEGFFGSPQDMLTMGGSQ